MTKGAGAARREASYAAFANSPAKSTTKDYLLKLGHPEHVPTLFSCVRTPLLFLHAWQVLTPLAELRRLVERVGASHGMRDVCKFGNRMCSIPCFLAAGLRVARSMK